MNFKAGDTAGSILTVERIDHEDPRLHLLVDELDQELKDRYPEEPVFGLDFSDPSVKEVRFAIALYHNQPVGCGALRPMEASVMELKRFYVQQAYRGRGIASRLLQCMEQLAEEEGCTILRLQTGIRQPEAISLYQKFGYHRIACYGEYAKTEVSVCFEKSIGSDID